MHHAIECRTKSFRKNQNPQGMVMVLNRFEGVKKWNAKTDTALLMEHEHRLNKEVDLQSLFVLHVT
jgi:hypothetical protein